MFKPWDSIKDSYITDMVSATVIYHGFYAPGGPATSGGNLDTSKAQFKIAKETRDASGNTLTLKYATAVTPTTPGVALYDQVWDSHLTLNYI